MNRFIEIFKEQTAEEVEHGVPQEMIRVRVADTGEGKDAVKVSDEQIVTQIDTLRAGAGWTKEKAPARLHECSHGPGDNCPCELRDETDLRKESGKETEQK